MLALACYFRRDLTAFRSAAERAMALNPEDANALAQLGILIAYTVISRLQDIEGKLFASLARKDSFAIPSILNASELPHR